MRVLVAYPDSMVGAAVAARLAAQHEVLAPRLDLRDQAAIDAAIVELRPQALVVDTPFSGGIAHNVAHPADLLLANLEVAANVFAAAHRHDVDRLLFVGSSCMYPRDAGEWLHESQLGSGTLEPTNHAYATAKLAGLELCRAFRRQYGRRYMTVVPANLYGPGDSFDSQHAHVIGALFARCRLACERQDRELVVWGSGKPIRDFLYVEDLADFLAHALERDLDFEVCNVGSGGGTSIAELVHTMAEITGFRGSLRFDLARPDGMPRKVLDAGQAQAFGWQAKTSLAVGLARTWAWYLEQPVAGRHAEEAPA